MSSMEPDVRDFLVKIANSLAISLFWMIANAIIGIAFNYAFFDDTPTLGNYIFYAWFLLSLGGLLFYLKRKWNL